MMRFFEYLHPDAITLVLYGVALLALVGYTVFCVASDLLGFPR